ncbi:MAG TPA: radical SAM family heme chaperone HemW [Acidobacteriaceae bacterium]|nr:radical SAM family heme chaperone HemW [Acidobacteriaceae bacterium]
MMQPLGVYLSVPFCRAKCTYCNFASGVFGAERMDAYVARVCVEIRAVGRRTDSMRAELPRQVDSVYLGGGTPSLLSAEQVRRVIEALRTSFEIADSAEITLECAPGQLSDETADALLAAGMNRVSFGVQSFVDAEARAVGRLHTREVCLKEIVRLQRAGVENINVDLIAGLPEQTAASWRESVDVAIATGVPHISMYMLEVDEDSRLGREMLAAGTRYGAAGVPDEDAIAEWYGAACEWLASAGVHQYEISNFAREGYASLHNMKYWRREPYVGFGLDAHSMLRSREEVVRFANTSELDKYLANAQETSLLPVLDAGADLDRMGREQQFEEALFLGLRMNPGVSLPDLRVEFGVALVESVREPLEDVIEAGLMERDGDRIRLTARGRMASNEVFGRLLVVAA